MNRCSMPFDELEQLKEMIKHSPDQVFFATISGVIMDVFPGTDRTYHLDYQAMIGKHYQELYSPAFSEKIAATLAKVRQANSIQKLTYSITVADMRTICDLEHQDEVFWYEARIIPVVLSHSDEQYILWWTRDITKHVLMEKQIQHVMTYDELTEVYNRRTILSHLHTTYTTFLSKHGNAGIVMIDIDNFKQCNDSYGHLSGDQVLHHVAKLLANNIREGDVIGRVGGEEFVIIFPETSIAKAQILTERLRQLIMQSVCHLESCLEYKVTVSMGISAFLSTDNHENDALNRADAAMYQAKSHGKNQVTLCRQLSGN